MKKLLLTLTMIAMAGAAFSASPVETGDKVPEFSAIDENGNEWKLSEQRASYIVFYFYPAAFTGGCTAQACSYRDHNIEFSLLDAVIVGISGDEHENLKQFKEHHGLNFTLLSDPDGMIAGLLGVPLRDGGTIETEVNGNKLQLARGVTISRWTFVVDGNKNKLIYKDTNVSAANDPGTVLKFISTHDQRKSCIVR